MTLNTASASVSKAKIKSHSLDNQGRIQVVDALRGFALLGIILTHVCVLYVDQDLQGTSSLLKGTLAYKLIYHLFLGKASTIFSFLFGLSFAMQVQSAKSMGRPFARLFAWRLATLFVIGFFNSLLFQGDILQTYAVVGLVLIPCIAFDDRKVAAAGIFLYSLGIAFRYLGLDSLDRSELFAVPLLPSLDGLQQLKYFLTTGRAFTIPALFLLGLYTGRTGVLRKAIEDVSLRQKMFLWGGASTIAVTCAYYLVKDYWELPERVYYAMNALKYPPQSFLYVAVVLSIYHFGWSGKLLRLLVPVGQMGLTTYLMQSVLLFQLNILGGSVGFGEALCVAALFFLGQCLFAYLWMGRFRFGPVEWLWRTLIHFKLQPLRK